MLNAALLIIKMQDASSTEKGIKQILKTVFVYAKLIIILWKKPPKKTFSQCFKPKLNIHT